MKIKIGNEILDSEKDSFMIILEPYEKKIIANLSDDNRLLMRPEGFAVQYTNAFYKWDEDFTIRYNEKTEADWKNEHEEYCKGCTKKETCTDNWVQCRHLKQKGIEKNKANEFFDNALAKVTEYHKNIKEDINEKL